MSKLPYMKWYPSDFDTDEVVRMMSFEQVGFYLVCLNHSWINSGLPGDLESIAALFKVSRPDFDRLWHLVGRRFELVAGRYVNPRQEKERADANKKSENSRRSAQARWDQEQKDCAPLDATSVRTQCERNANAMPRAYDSDSDSGSKEINNSSSEGGAGGGQNHPTTVLVLVKPLPAFWQPLLEAAHDARMSFDPSPDGKAANLARSMILEEGFRAVRGIRERIVCEQYADPQYVPTLVNYLRDNLWRETLRPRQRGAPLTRKEQQNAKAFERILQERAEREQEEQEYARRKVHAS